MASGALLGGDDSRDNPKNRWGESKVYMRKGSMNKSKPAPSQTLTEEDSRENPKNRFDAASDDSSSLNRKNPAAAGNAAAAGMSQNGNVSAGSGAVRSENRVVINLASKSKQEMQELRRKLTGELEQVKSLFKRLESREIQMRSYNSGVVVENSGYSPPPQMSGNGSKNPAGGRGNLQHLSIPMPENSQVGSDFVEKEKRTPKANQYYRNSDFVLGKDKFPPPESNKKAKSNGVLKTRPDFVVGKIPSQALKHCSSILMKLMKHKHAWVFNSPVDVKGLGLHDYFTIVKHPMDLGSVKSKLNANWYNSIQEFAEDIRLTFRNAMTYNPKGHDVHIMAEQMLKAFEDRWKAFEAEFVDVRPNPRYSEVDDGGFSQSLSHPHSLKRAPPPMEPRKVFDRSESSNAPMEVKSKPVTAPGVRVAAPKKPKAKDPDKRDMTYEEKQKLSMNLQSLPSEKLDLIVQIIKKRNSSLCQHDDEIEVDIDSVDTETLWELDRFVTNYKKSLSKNKKKAELANQSRSDSERIAATGKPAQVPIVEEIVANNDRGQAGEEKSKPSASPVDAKKQEANASRSSSSSSSSSDSGSSSSDSDSESSSAYGSDPAHSPRT